MKARLKNLSEQVIVITGASSGIGLATARMAAKKGARLVLAARSDEALSQLVNEIEQDGGEAVAVTADVGNQEDIRQIAQTAISTFGGFDTWVNNAGVSIYGKIEDVPTTDMRQLYETNFWGVVYGSLEAVQHLKERGGALINIGSTVSERAVPLQGIYSSSKHAVKGFTDALRMELEADGAPISVTLVKPGAIDTPYTEHAKNYMEAKPKHAPPVYSPKVVAETILYCAAHPVRDIFAGGGGKMQAALGQNAPRLTDKLMETVFIKATKSVDPPLSREFNGLDQPSGTLLEYGSYPGKIKETSLYTTAALHPALTIAAFTGLGLAAAALWNGLKRNARSDGHQSVSDVERDYEFSSAKIDEPNYPLPS
jgi:short-subunit dehydrogenase